MRAQWDIARDIGSGTQLDIASHRGGRVRVRNRRPQEGFDSLGACCRIRGRGQPGGGRAAGRFVSAAAQVGHDRDQVVDGTHEGLAAARARGQRLGRPPAMTEEQIRQARALLTRPDESVSSIARLLGISRTTLYKYVPDLTTDGRAALDVHTGPNSM